MAIMFFHDESNSRNQGNKLFLNEWLEENKNNKATQFFIQEFKKVKSGKGYLVVTEDFNCFIWNNAKETKLLLEALQAYVKEPNLGRTLYVVLKNPKKGEFNLGCDMALPMTWHAMGNGYTTLLDHVSSQTDESSGNPFLPTP